MNLEGDIFEMNFLNEFEELSKDKVKNVRMLVAKVLQKHLRKNGSKQTIYHRSSTKQ